jgi:hypothetical protein
VGSGIDENQYLACCVMCMHCYSSMLWSVRLNIRYQNFVWQESFEEYVVFVKIICGWMWKVSYVVDCEVVIKNNLNKSVINTLSLCGWKNLLCYASWVRLQCGSMCGRMEKFLINTLYGVKLSADYHLLKKIYSAEVLSFRI